MDLLDLLCDPPDEVVCVECGAQVYEEDAKKLSGSEDWMCRGCFDLSDPEL